MHTATALVYGTAHVPFMHWELQHHEHIGEESCISRTRAFYRNLQIKNVEKLVRNKHQTGTQTGEARHSQIA